jgi:TonB family protein
MASVTAVAMLALLSQAAPESLAPSGKWTVAHEPGECLLSRPFGPGERSITLGVLRLPASPGGTLLLVEPGGTASTRRGSGKIVVQPSGDRFNADWTVAPRTGRTGGLTRIEPDTAFWDALPQATGLTFEGFGGASIELPTGKMTAALSAYGACNDDMLRRWGADPAAMIKPGSWITKWLSYNDYPDAAIRRRAEGRAVVLIAVDADGRPTGCKTVKSSGDADLDKASCAIASGGARVPRSADDRPIDRWFVLPVTWSLP